MKTSYILSATILSLIVPSANAQTGDKAEDHSGHNHAQQTQTYNGPLSAAPIVEHVYTEAPDDHVIGAEDAPTTIIAYVSVTCPHCSKWFIEEWPTFKAEQIDTGKVRFILREYPTDPQELAMTGFIIASCAPEEQYFNNIVFQMVSQEAILNLAMTGKGREAYAPVGANAGLKTEAEIIACFDKSDGNKKIRRAVDRATAAEITGVPSFFVDGVEFPGEASALNLGKLIDHRAEVGVSVSTPTPPKPAE